MEKRTKNYPKHSKEAEVWTRRNVRLNIGSSGLMGTFCHCSWVAGP